MPEPASAWWQLADGAASSSEPALARGLAPTLADMQPTSAAALNRALRGRITLAKVDAAFAFRRAQSELEDELFKRTVRSARKAATDSARLLGSDVSMDAIERVARQRARTAARMMTQQSRLAMRDAIRRMQREGFSQRQIAENVRGMAGLNRQQVNGVLNRASALRDAGKTQDQIARARRRLTARQRSQRARFVARHETKETVELAVENTLEQAIDNGDVEDVGQRWVSIRDKRRDPICARLHGQRVPLGQKFRDPATGKRYKAPPDPHVTCRCSRHFTFKKIKAKAA